MRDGVRLALDLYRPTRARAQGRIPAILRQTRYLRCWQCRWPLDGLVFDLLPTSYLFRRRHAIRVAIAGADPDHFAPVPADAPPSVRIYRGEGSPSHINLPVLPR